MHRLCDGRELKTTVRSGTRFGCRNFVVSTVVHSSEEAGPARFGFVVSKKVGNAVVRNLVKRRLREAAWLELKAGFSGADVVVRALPAAADADWEHLVKDLNKGLKRTAGRATPPRQGDAP